jgi:hypothetical protein
MKIIGRDDVVRYDESHFVRQTPGKDGKWQNSNWLHWWDLERRVGGVHRIGHEYNGDGGAKVAAWTNLITPTGIYKHVVHLPLREADKLPRGWGGGDEVCRVEYLDGQNVWTINDPAEGIEARLACRDFHPAFRGFPGAGRTAEDIAPHHLDVGGSVSGYITMRGTRYAVDGLGERDLGWGHRNLYTMLSHRYAAGCFGPDLVFNAWMIHNGVNNSIEGFGWVVRNADTVIFAKDMEIVAYTEVDSASTRGGRIRMWLANDEVFDCELTAVAPGLMNFFHNMPNNNTLCRVESGGRVGSGMLETSMNYHQGTRSPDKLLRALAANGFYPGDHSHPNNTAGGPFLAKRTL